MKIKDFLAASDVAIDMRAADKSSLLKDLSTRAASALDLPADAVANEIYGKPENYILGIGRLRTIADMILRGVQA